MADRSTPASREGAHHAWRMHLTTWSLLIGTLPALLLFVWLAGKDHATVVTALRNPFVALPLAFLALIGIWHMLLGMRTILEDYIHGRWAFRLLSGLSILFGLCVFTAIAFALTQLLLVR
jgi:succinate dehydrogenase / fumarate reductase, membrane anchor subunit